MNPPVTTHARSMLALANTLAKLAEEWDDVDERGRAECTRNWGVPADATTVSLLERASNLARHAAAEIEDEKFLQHAWRTP